MISLQEVLGLPYGKHTGLDMERKAIAEIERLRLALKPFADCGKHLKSHKFVLTPITRIWVPRTTNDPQPPSILVKHLLDAAKVLPN